MSSCDTLAPLCGLHVITCPAQNSVEVVEVLPRLEVGVVREGPKTDRSDPHLSSFKICASRWEKRKRDPAQVW